MKKTIAPLCCTLIIAVLCGCSGNQTGKNESDSPITPTAAPTISASPSTNPAAVSSSPEATAAAETVQDYFPILQNTHYIYEGIGFEYAAYDVYIDYTTDSSFQTREDNSGTVTARVVTVESDRATCVLSRGETYFRENLLEHSDGTEEILLMNPIAVGTSWTLSDGKTREITDTAAVVDTPSGTYTAVAVETASDDGTVTRYYAKNIGLVKTVSVFDGYEITSSLSVIEEDVPFTQTIRFYYPNINDETICYVDREIGFNTNDVTRKALEAAYKEAVPASAGQVFSNGTAINSLYLNDDGMVYIDLSSEFLTEMNAGAEYESMMLQCIANTFGNYYFCDKVLLTIDNELYESGHIKLDKFEYLTVDIENAVAAS